MQDKDARLINKSVSGDDEAFAKIVKIYLKPVYNFVYRLAGDRDTADDLTQETFVKAWKNLSRFDRNKSFKTWLFTIARNTTFDWFRKKKEIPFSSFADDEGENWLENVAGEEILPDEILARADTAERLEKILEKLPPLYRTILLLHYKEDFTLHEIAEILDEPYNTVKSRHQRAIKRLKQAILSSDAPEKTGYS